MATAFFRRLSNASNVDDHQKRVVWNKKDSALPISHRLCRRIVGALFICGKGTAAHKLRLPGGAADDHFPPGKLIEMSPARAVKMAADFVFSDHYFCVLARLERGHGGCARYLFHLPDLARSPTPHQDGVFSLLLGHWAH